jgi:hemerythrin
MCLNYACIMVLVSVRSVVALEFRLEKSQRDMQSFLWSRHFMTGLADVDQQHRHLVGLINQLGGLLFDSASDQLLIQEVLVQIKGYTCYHFAEEEMLMRQAAIDERHLQSHLKLHRQFVMDLDAMLSNQSTITQEEQGELLEFMVHWLAYHILGTDKNMGRQVAAIRAGKTPCEAFELENDDEDSRTEPLLIALKGLFHQVYVRNRELQELNLTLERKVAERTQELRQANQHLNRLAMTDGLTGLANRRHALSHLETLWIGDTDSPNYPISCMMIDADQFKEVNDTHGHAAGDRVIYELGQLLRDALRSDDMVARLGGDEFLVICPHTPYEDALNLAASLHAKICRLQVPTGDAHWQGSVSLGVATQSESLTHYEALIKAADGAVYCAKKAGKNCVRGAR